MKDKQTKKINFHFFLNHQKQIIIVLGILATLFGLIGFCISDKTNGFFDVFNNTIALFAFAYPDDDNTFLDIAKFLAIVTIFFGAITLFFAGKINAFITKNIQKTPYDLVIGLSGKRYGFLDSCDSSSVLILESDTNNSYLDSLKEHGYGVIHTDAKDGLEKLDFQHLQNCVISTDDDRQNITLAMVLIENIKEVKNQKLFVRIDNRELNILFKQNVIIDNETKHLDVVPFSIYENITKELFSQHSILGYQTKIIEGDEDYSIVLVGSSNLALQIIYHLSIMAHLPNENHLTLYCIDKDSDKFYERVKKHFPSIENIPSLSIKPINHDFESLAFYTQELWHTKNLTNIILANEDEEKNLYIVTTLQDTTFVKKIAQDRFDTKVLYAMYENVKLSDKMNSNKGAFKNFFSFGTITKATSYDNIIDQKLDSIAKLINYGYEEKSLKIGDINKDEIEKKWFELSTMHKKESNKAQAMHIDIKLLALGLQKKESDKDTHVLLQINKKALDVKLTDRTITDEKLQNYKSEYFPKTFSTLFDKIARSEHNRWDAFHYLHGWSYANIRNDKAKEHDCLQPIVSFDTDAKKETYQYDIQALLFIPYYLANTGYEIVKL